MPPTPPPWLHDVPAPDGALTSDHVHLRWSLADGHLRGHIDGHELDLDLDEPTSLKLGRARRLRPRWLGLGEREEHWLAAELRRGDTVLTLTAKVSAKKHLEGLPWWDTSGHTVSAEALQSWTASMLAMPGVDLSGWPDEETIDPRQRPTSPSPQASSTKHEPKAAPPTQNAWTRAKIVPKTLLRTLSFPWFMLVAFGFAGTTAFATIGSSWVWGLGGGMVAAFALVLLTTSTNREPDNTDTLTRYTLWAFVILPIYGVSFGLSHDALILTSPQEIAIPRLKSGALMDDFYRFNGAHVELRLSQKHEDLSVAPLVRDGWNSQTDPVTIWLVCQGDELLLEACTASWNAPPGTLFEAVPYKGSDGAEHNQPRDARALVQDIIQTHTLKKDTLSRVELFRGWPASSSLLGIWMWRGLFALYAGLLAFVWLILGHWGTRDDE